MLRSGEIASKPNSPGRVNRRRLAETRREDRESALGAEARVLRRLDEHEQPRPGQSARLAHAGHGGHRTRRRSSSRRRRAPTWSTSRSSARTAVAVCERRPMVKDLGRKTGQGPTAHRAGGEWCCRGDGRATERDTRIVSPPSVNAATHRRGPSGSVCRVRRSASPSHARRRHRPASSHELLARLEAVRGRAVARKVAPSASVVASSLGGLSHRPQGCAGRGRVGPVRVGEHGADAAGSVAGSSRRASPSASPLPV